MRGSYRIVVQNKRIRYDFEIRRNLTVIQGKSATGKTTLIDMIREYYENGPASGVGLRSDKECTVLSGRNWERDLSAMQESIVFIDEGNEFVFSDRFASVIQDTDNYYVIVTREAIPSLPYSIEEIYGIRDSGKYGTLKQTYNEFFHLYRADVQKKIGRPKRIITEDSNAGHQFFKAVADEEGLACLSAGGKSNIFAKVVEMLAGSPDSGILVIADGAAFGAEMEKMTRLLSGYEQLALYLPESFEWLLLRSGILEEDEIKKILAAPGTYIDSQVYFSWERFFTALLVRKTDKSYLKYTKRTLNAAYLNEKVRDKIIAAIGRS